MHLPRPLSAALVVLTLSALLIASPTSTAADPANTVEASRLAFTPGTLTIPAGTTITWTNADGFAHTVTADNGSFDSGFFGAGQSFSMTFDTPGTYFYYCIPHGSPGGFGMAGVVDVEEQPQPPLFES